MKHLVLAALVLITIAISCSYALDVDVSDSVEIVFIIDISGSMSEISNLRDSVSYLLNVLEDSSSFFRVGGVGFADSVYIWDFDYSTDGYQMTSELDEFYEHINIISPTGGGDPAESVIDAIYDAASEYDWTDGTVKIIILFTGAQSHYPGDGTGYSDVTYDELLSFLIANGFRLYVNLDHSYIGELPPEYPNDSIYFYIAESTGGRGYGPETGWGTVFNDIINDLLSSNISCNQSSGLPEKLVCVYPNPFNSSCEILAPVGSTVEIYDAGGHLIDLLEEAPYIWQPDKSLNSGIYLIRIVSNKGVIKKRVCYMK